MKGKIGLIIGFGLGYVLGSRAGRQRYEQIKQTAEKVWESDGVQRVSNQVRGYVSDQVATAQNYVVGKGKQLLHVATAPKQAEDQAVRESDGAR